jgi:hypothetical protein
VFISYHHDEDQEYADRLRKFYGRSKAIIDKSMHDDLSHLQNETILRKIRQDYLRDSTVTVVLVGEHTWGRKWVDWEIYSSLRGYADRTVNGLLAVYLPTHRKKHFRLTDNLKSGYAVRVKWEEVEARFIDAVHEAWSKRRNKSLIDNTRQLRERNAPLESRTYNYAEVERQECFVATAAYGTPFATEIDILRRWRDYQLSEYWWGERCIHYYYSLGPKISRFIRSKRWAKELTRRIILVFLKLIG